MAAHTDGFAVGDLVKFVNGGPRLIILRLMDDTIPGEAGIGRIAHVGWFNTADCAYEYNHIFLPVALLVHATAD